MLKNEDNNPIQMTNSTNPSSEMPQKNIENIDSMQPTEVTSQPTGTVSTEEVGLINIIKGTFAIVKKKLFLFLGLSILNFIILGVLIFIALPIILVSTLKIGTVGIFLEMFVFALVILLLNFLFYGAIASQAVAAMHGLSVALGQSFSTTYKNTLKAINLVWKIFVYSRIWLLVFILLLYPVAHMLLASLGGTAFMIINFILGLAGLLCIVFALIRFLRATMAFPTLMARPELSAKEVFKQSIEMTKGKWWLIFSFVTIFTFLIAFIPVAINLAALFTGMGSIKILSFLATAIFGILSYSMTVSFAQVLADNLSDKHKTTKLHTGVLVGAILIFLTPIIFGVALSFMGLMTLKPLISTVESVKIATQEQFNSSTQTVPATSPKNKTGSLIKSKDPQRVQNLEAILAAIEKYHTENNIYPNKSHCSTNFFTKQWPYLKDFKEPNDVSYLEITARLLYSTDGTYINVMCNAPIYQYLGENNFALYVKVESPTHGNIDKIFTNASEAIQFKTQTSGQYYIIMHSQPTGINQSARPISPKQDR